MTAGYPVPQPSARKYLSRGNTKVMLTTVPHHPLSAVFGHEKARQRISARDGRFQSVGTGSIRPASALFDLLFLVARPAEVPRWFGMTLGSNSGLRMPRFFWLT